MFSIAFIDEDNKRSSGDWERNKQAVEQRKIEHISRRHTLREPTLQDIASNKSLTAAIFQFSAPLSHSGTYAALSPRVNFLPLISHSFPLTMDILTLAEVCVVFLQTIF
uniref:Uncharacterized protein n=1 Tax=Micrurus surinamensis TaxID=129470 RepID=A0A2D4PAY8_MICSU